ncbi:MAG: leucine-rich repeat domain-containing protein [Candidatus Symbiothrix sp.]|jgi:hypothetical protein|nr:leucine-rich repeat domain-containing protein [Candidatus Symbiothrix sp.]
MRTRILFLSMMLLLGTATGFAQDANGTCGEKLTWTLSLSDSTLTVRGTGEMENYASPRFVPWSSNSFFIARVVIEEGATSIGVYAFADCSNLTEITIPTSVTSIGAYAFAGCSSLTEFTIPASVTSVEAGAFYACSSLTEIIVENENGYYSSGNGVLFNKDKTILLCYPAGKEGEYTVPSGVTSVGTYAFAECNSLTEITISSSVTSIGMAAFYYCLSLTEITIPGSVTSIGVRAFAECNSLTEITIPSSVTSIGDEAFYSCSSLTELTIPGSVTSIGASAFSYCSSLTELTIPSSVTSIENYAFAECSSLTELTIPGSVTSIGASAFSGCYSLTELTIPSSVTSIEEYAFHRCSGLTSLTIPNSVTSIGDWAFSWCSSLTSVTNLNPEPQEINSNVFYAVNLENVFLYVPAASIETYRTTAVWQDFKEVKAYVPAAIEAPAAGSGIRLYPNPVAESFRIDGITVPTQVTVSDFRGRRVWTQTVAGNEPVAVGHLPQGVYLVHVNGKTVKVIKR